MESKEKKGKFDFITIKVRPSTYRRLRIFKNRMELLYLEDGKEVRFSMDDIINALINLIEKAEIKFTREHIQTS